MTDLPSSLRLAGVLLGSALAVTTAHAAAPAAPDTSAAAQAFANGQSAQLAGNNRLAAEQFELAHSIAPSVHALRSAARARFLAKSHARAATHAVRILDEYPDDADSVALANEILEQTRADLVEFEVQCDAPCTLSKDGKMLVADGAEQHHFFTSPGAFELVASFDAGAAAPESFTTAAGNSYSASFAEPEPEPEPEPIAAPIVPEEPATSASSTTPEPADASDANEDRPRSARRAHPAWFYGGLAATAAVGGVTLWSGLDTRSAHQEFEDEPSKQAWSNGRNKQLRTNILIGATAGLGAVTALLAAFGTDWSKGRRSSKKRKKNKDVALELGPLGLQGRF